MCSTVIALCQLIRPKQWIKNIFIGAPLIFSGLIQNSTAFKASIVAFILFSCMSSITYILNDIHDIQEDKKHPIKSKKRPLAASRLSLSSAWGLAIFLSLIEGSLLFIWAYMIPVLMLYLILTLSYTYWIKKYPVVDIFTIAAGFVLRVYAGAIAIHVPMSHWMFITTLCLALYLASIKRLQELQQHGSNSRKVLSHYTINLLEHYAQTSAIGTLLFYSIFILSNKPSLIFTIPIVLFGLFRYQYLVSVKKDGESPTDVLYSDWPLGLTILLWTIGCILFF